MRKGADAQEKPAKGTWSKGVDASGNLPPHGAGTVSGMSSNAMEAAKNKATALAELQELLGDGAAERLKAVLTWMCDELHRRGNPEELGLREMLDIARNAGAVDESPLSWTPMFPRRLASNAVLALDA